LNSPPEPDIFLAFPAGNLIGYDAALGRGHEMKRRDFLGLAGAAATWRFAAQAQQTGPARRIGVFVPGSERTHLQFLSAFRDALTELGYVEGKNYVLLVRYGEGHFEQFSGYAGELIRERPEVILATGTAVVSALRQQTRDIPIIFVQVADPVASGFVQSIPHPGGNVTGFTNFEPEMIGKWLGLLKEVAPQVRRASLVLSPKTTAAGGADFRKVFQAAATSLDLEPAIVEYGDAPEIDDAIRAISRRPASGFVIGPGGSTFSQKDLFVGAAAHYQLPAVYPYTEFAASGGLLAYGADIAEQYRRASIYVDRALKGEKPTDLPVQSPTKFQMIINLKAASSLGLTVSPTLLIRADEVIE
jgi:putative ABC transport system substrate-binding protein